MPCECFKTPTRPIHGNIRLSQESLPLCNGGIDEILLIIDRSNRCLQIMGRVIDQATWM